MSKIDTRTDRMRRAGIVAGRWPYGPNIDEDARAALLDWTDVTGYRLAVPRRACLHWLLGQTRRCGGLVRYYHPGMLGGSYGPSDVEGGHLRSTLDHPTFWTRDGAPALLLAQPYIPLPGGWAGRLRMQWPALRVEVTESGPWYGHHTCGVFITPEMDG